MSENDRIAITIAVTGGRDYTMTAQDWLWLGQELGRELSDTFMPFEIRILHGGATGVDSAVGHLLKEMDYRVNVLPADWMAHGNTAGPIRNAAMAKECDLVLAFPGGKGTANMIAAAKKLGKEVRESPSRLR